MTAKSTETPEASAARDERIKALISTSADDLKSTLPHITDLETVQRAAYECEHLGKKTHHKHLVQRIRKLQRPTANRQPPTSNPQPITVALEKIIADADLQIRCENDADQIDNLADAMDEGADIPPVDLFEDESLRPGPRFYIGDGWHRVLAARLRKRKEIRAIVHPGGRGEALKFALGANAAHGLRRTNRDKRNAVEIALQEFPELGDRAIAKLCKVTHPFVMKLRKVVTVTTPGTETTTTTTTEKPEQTDFWDEINEVLKPIPAAVQAACSGSWWTNDTIPIDKRLEAINSLEDQFGRELQRIKDLKASLTNQATATESKSS